MSALNSGYITDQTCEDFRGFPYLFLLIENTRQHFRILRHGFSQPEVFIFYKSPDLLWGPPGLTFNWFRVLSREQSGRDVMLTTNFHLASGTSLYRQI